MKTLTDRKLEVQEDYARNRFEYVMSQRIETQFQEPQMVGAQMFVTRELWEDIKDREEMKDFIETQLNEQLDRLLEQVEAYDEAIGEEAGRYRRDKTAQFAAMYGASIPKIRQILTAPTF